MVYVPRKPRTTKYVRKGNKGVRRPKVSTPLYRAITNVINRKSETKYKITPVTEVSLSTLTSPAGDNALNVIAQGNARNEREGNSIMPTFIDIRGQVQATNQEAVWYKLILLEKDVNDSPASDLFETDTGNVSGASQDLKAIYQRMNNHKYKILKTRILKTGTVSNTANDSGAVAMFHMKCPLKGKMIFDDGVNAPQKRTLSLLVLARRANNDDTTGLTFEYTFNSKFYYKDM